MGRDRGAVFFDLFFTLVVPRYPEGRREYDVLGISQEIWERFAEDREHYLPCATGKVTDPRGIIDAILRKMDVQASEQERDEIMRLRQERMRRALTEIDPVILEELTQIRRQGWRLGLISNADVIDILHWRESPLCALFDGAAFSCKEGRMKPDAGIYRAALDGLAVGGCPCFFVGDGGSDELMGAKRAGMTTVLTEYLSIAGEDRRDSLMKYADYHVADFRDIAGILSR